MKKTPQQILQNIKKELKRKFFYERGYWTSEDLEDGSIQSFVITKFQSFIEAEIEYLEGMRVSYINDDKTPDVEKKYKDGYNQTIFDQISHLKELLETLKK